MDESVRGDVEAAIDKYVSSVDDMISSRKRLEGEAFGERTQEDELEEEKLHTQFLRMEKMCRHNLGLQIALAADVSEYGKMDIKKPGEIIGWAIKAGSSSNLKVARRWDFFRKREGMLSCRPPTNEFECEPLEPNDLKDYGDDRLQLALKRLALNEYMYCRAEASKEKNAPE